MKEPHIKYLDNKISFESLLGEISSNLLSIPIESVDAAIESSMKMLVEFFDADRCHLGEFSSDQSKIEVSYFYTRSGINIPPINVIGEDYLPFVFGSIKQDEIVDFTSPSELPDYAELDCAEFERLGIKSLLVLPLQIGKEVQFGLSLSTITKHIKWEEETINRIMIVANILAHTIQRKMAHKQILDEKEWSEAVMQGMPQITYVFDLQGRLKRWNKNAEAVLGFSSEEMKDKFIGELYSKEDMKRVMKVVEKVIEDGQEHQVEYDFINKSGEIVPFYYGSGKLMEIGGEQYIVGQTVDISEIKKAQEKIASQLEEIKELKNQLEAENIYLRHELKSVIPYGDIIGESDVLKHIFYRVKQVAPLHTTVLLEGETGTGKELFAKDIHKKSTRSNKPLITVNCAALPPSLIESELFGHERGAFTGALQKQIGRFELANGGTLFLDEIGEIPIELQVKLLRVLQEGEFERIGNSKTLKTDVRIIAATNRNLEEEIKSGRFRKDLFYRLSVYPITIAPLRDRPDDIPHLTEHFVKRFNQKFKKNITRIPRKTIEQLKLYDWPGNIRELENIIERAMILSTTSTLKVEKLKSIDKPSHKKFQRLEDYERDYIINVLNHTMWRINGTKGAASILDMHPETLRSRMRKLGIERPNTTLYFH
jgi:PAS domain S-box-containing protein